jgi:NhaP-type Na+/H+ or K+/H+ antiporter
MAYLVFILLIFLYSLVSHRLERTVITGPLVFCLAGLAFSFDPSVLESMRIERESFLILTELALVLLLFSDATNIDFRVLRRYERLPLRLLGIGMPLTILLGTLGAALLFPGLSIWEAGILGAILAPTDAALGEIIVKSPQLPFRIRQAIFVEAGLNDGLAVPFLIFFIDIGRQVSEGGGHLLFRYALEQVGIGASVGLLVGFAGGWLLALANRQGWMSESFQHLGVMAIPLLSMMTVEPLRGSMFIAAFVAGIALRGAYRGAVEKVVEFSGDWGQLLNMFVFFTFGLIAGPLLKTVTWPYVIYALLSLTIIRMAPVALSLIGAGLSSGTKAFVGWFGPRGLASIVLGVVFLAQQTQLPGEQAVKLAVIVTVLISIFAHGLSAQPGIHWYARHVGELDAESGERAGIPQVTPLLKNPTADETEEKNARGSMWIFPHS